MIRKIASALIGAALLVYLFAPVVGVFFADGGSTFERVSLASIPLALAFCFLYVSHICRKCIFLSSLVIGISLGMLGVVMHAIMTGVLKGDVTLLVPPVLIYIGTISYMIVDSRK